MQAEVASWILRILHHRCGQAHDCVETACRAVVELDGTFVCTHEPMHDREPEPSATRMPE